MRKWIALSAALIAVPLAAKDSLGVFEQWAVFRDAETPRCYAIAQPQRAQETGAFASVGTWPKRNVRGQLHIRLSRVAAERARVRLIVGTRRFDLAAKGRNAWAADKAMDAAIIAAMRSTDTMSVTSLSTAGRRFTDRYDLGGAATAMDAATVGCPSR